VATSTSANTTTRQVGKMTVRIISDLEVELTREFNAPRRLVFEALSKPEHITRWWGKRDAPMVQCEMDFRPGGHYRFVIRKEKGQEYVFRGEYREIAPPERIVQTFEVEGLPGSISFETLTLTEHDGRTTLGTRSRMESIDARDAMLRSGMEAGAAETYDRLEELLAELSR
jgi:uncharacterized protein YndB with AHSA1/START domain